MVLTSFDRNAAAVGYNVNIMKNITDFYGNSYLYLGCLSKQHVEVWKSTSLEPMTAKYMVTLSRSRISELVTTRKRKHISDGNLLLSECMRSAARRGDKRGVVRVRQYAARKKMRLSSSRLGNAMDAAARSGSLSLMTYLLDREFVPMGKMTMVEAVHAPNSVEVVRWLMGRKCLISEEAEEEAAKIGNLPVLRVFKNRPFSPGGFGNRVMSYSGLSGSIPTVDFVRTEGGCKLTSVVMYFATVGGHLELIKHLRRLGIAWDDNVCWMSAFHGHLRVLEWVRSQDPPAPWDYFTLNVAKIRKHRHIVKYCEENNCPREE